MMKVYTSKREQITLSDKPMAKGGEGSVYNIISSPIRLYNTCVKIYHSSKKKQSQEKRIKYMVNNPPQKILGDGYMLGWPIDWVSDSSGTFLGFVMPLGFPGSKELVNLTVYGMSKKIRDDEEWRRRYDLKLGKPALLARLKLICNIAIPVHILHSTGKYVLEDFKPQNILITKEGRVTIVDMDSIQIASGNSVLFPGTAATPEYLPPEYYNSGVGKVKSVPIQKSWDNFSLGVVFYQLLLGIHPYSVVPKVMPTDGNCGPTQNVPRNLFPFGRNSHMVASYGKPHNNFQCFPKVLQDLFIRTFSDNTSNRPNANEWGRIIHEIVIRGEKGGPKGGGSGGTTSNDSIHPLKVNGKYGFVTDKGRTVIDFIWYDASEFSDDLASVKNEHGLYGYINRKGDVVIPCAWNYAGDFVKGKARVRNNTGDEFFIDKKGNIISSISRHHLDNAPIHPVKVNGKYGFVEENGRTVIDFIWYDANEFCEDLASVRNTHGLYGYINRKGDVVIPCAWKYAGDFVNGLAKVKNNSGVELLIDKRGKIVRKLSNDNQDSNGKSTNDNSTTQDKKTMPLSHEIFLWSINICFITIGAIMGGIAGGLIGLFISLLVVGLLSKIFPSLFKPKNK